MGESERRELLDKGRQVAKKAAAEMAALMVEPGMTLGLGTGTTVDLLLPVLAARRLELRCVATSPATERSAVALGLQVEEFDRLSSLDMAIDGADQVAPDGWMVKGGGGAHAREKIVAASAELFVVIVSNEKLVSALAAPVPLELSVFGLASTMRRLGNVVLRRVAPSPDGGLIADWWGEIGDPAELAARFDSEPGVVAHGLFPAGMAGVVISGEESGEARKVLG